ncbi:MAG: AbrB/MazE/SpoVT family DNA-binding domain-containing protein [Oscillospiraceae bacterium]|nr:AbrB/MazE/SpoVT family DNA-binding domain-containing protein [Oscillospiraceae bacterium]
MQTTGIVRKLDDLGRITIPQNIKRRLNITGGDKLEVFLLSDGVAFKKYSALGENEISRKCCVELRKSTGKLCFVADKEGVIVSGAEDDEGRGLKNKEQMKKVISKGERYNGLSADKSEWITMIPIGEKGSVGGVFVAVHGKQEDASVHTILDYTAAVIGAHEAC